MNGDKLLSIMQKITITAAIVMFLCCVLTACKTIHDVKTEYVDRYVHDSVYVEKIDTIVKIKEHRDSVIFRDSIYVNVWQSADTVYKIKEVWKYRDKISIKYDTIRDVKIDVQYRDRIDTTYVDKQTIKTEYVEKKLSSFQKFLIWGGGISLIVCIFLISSRISNIL